MQTVVQKLLMYGTGREVEPADMPQVRQIVRNAKAGGYRFFDLVMAWRNPTRSACRACRMLNLPRPQATVAAAKQ